MLLHRPASVRYGLSFVFLTIGLCLASATAHAQEPVQDDVLTVAMLDVTPVPADYAPATTIEIAPVAPTASAPVSFWKRTQTGLVGVKDKVVDFKGTIGDAKDLVVGWQRTRGAVFDMYVSYATLQMLDAHSTTRALGHGAVEANPMLKKVAGHPVGLTLLKAGLTTYSIYGFEKARKVYPRGVKWALVAVNGVYTAVVINNYRH